MRAKKKWAVIREYVETELDRTVRDHPDIRVSKGIPWIHEEDEQTEAMKRGLAWTIRTQDTAGDYVIEARVEQKELLIWFGYSSVGLGGIHQVMFSAVHIHLESLLAEWCPYPRKSFDSLSAVLERMLKSRGRLSEIIYPMNNRYLT